MIYLVAIALGVMIIMAISGVIYVIHGVLSHFGLDSEEVFLNVVIILLVLMMAGVLGTVALELLGMI